MNAAENPVPLTPRKRGDVRLAALAWVVVGILMIGLLVGAGSDSRPAPSIWQKVARATPAPLPLPPRVRQAQADEAQTRFRQGVMMLHAKQYEHALVAFHRVLTLDPESPEAYVNSGFALLGLKREREAVDFFSGAIDLRKDQLNAYFGLALALEAVGDLEGAVGAMRTYAHRAKPEDPFQRKAWAALWEWESTLRERRAATPPSESATTAKP